MDAGDDDDNDDEEVSRFFFFLERATTSSGSGCESCSPCWWNTRAARFNRRAASSRKRATMRNSRDGSKCKNRVANSVDMRR